MGPRSPDALDEPRATTVGAASEAPGRSPAALARPEAEAITAPMRIVPIVPTDAVGVERSTESATGARTPTARPSGGESVTVPISPTADPHFEYVGVEVDQAAGHVIDA